MEQVVFFERHLYYAIRIYIFHFTIIFRVTLNIIEMMMASKVNKCGDDFCPPMLLMCAVPFTHLMLVLNSSANIVIYCLLGDGFRYIMINCFLLLVFLVYCIYLVPCNSRVSNLWQKSKLVEQVGRTP